MLLDSSRSCTFIVAAVGRPGKGRQLFARLQADVPYVGLSASDICIALSSKFAYSGFNEWFQYGPYALNIKAAS
jgi:hypothetical protein